MEMVEAMQLNRIDPTLKESSRNRVELACGMIRRITQSRVKARTVSRLRPTAPVCE